MSFKYKLFFVWVNPNFPGNDTNYIDDSKYVHEMKEAMGFPLPLTIGMTIALQFDRTDGKSLVHELNVTELYYNHKTGLYSVRLDVSECFDTSHQLNYKYEIQDSIRLDPQWFSYGWENEPSEFPRSWCL